MKNMKSEIIKIGEVGVDSAQLMICDPAYIDSNWKKPDSEGKNDHAHDIYRDIDDGSLWQWCVGSKPTYDHVNAIPGSYEDIIPEYGKNMNTLRKEGKMVLSDLDPIPHIPNGEFSYRGLCKSHYKGDFAQVKYPPSGHPGLAVTFTSGFGDGTYEVFAEIIDTGFAGKRIKKVWIELIVDEDKDEDTHEE
jgi:hypothetical protein